MREQSRQISLTRRLVERLTSMRVTICACVSTPLGWKCQRWNGIAAVQGPRSRIGNADGRFMQSRKELGLPIERVNRKVVLNVRGTQIHTHTKHKNQPASMVQHNGNLSNLMILALIVNMNALPVNIQIHPGDRFCLPKKIMPPWLIHFFSHNRGGHNTRQCFW